jgi:hypothetical protein
MAKVKMVGNMMLLKKPTASKYNKAGTPDNDVETQINTTAHDPAAANSRDGDTHPINPDPAKRPSMAPPQ